MGDTFSKSVDLLHRGLSTLSLRREVIANNIANADTPNFKRSDVSFEHSLQQALKSETEPQDVLKTTDPRHIQLSQHIDYRTVKPRVRLDYLTQSQNNGNNVNVEEELVSADQTQMLYSLLSRSVTFEFKQMKKVLI